jgi:hypothetical protein
MRSTAWHTPNDMTGAIDEFRISSIARPAAGCSPSATISTSPPPSLVLAASSDLNLKDSRCASRRGRFFEILACEPVRHFPLGAEQTFMESFGRARPFLEKDTQGAEEVFRKHHDPIECRIVLGSLVQHSAGCPDPGRFKNPIQKRGFSNSDIHQAVQERYSAARNLHAGGVVLPDFRPPRN